MCTSECCKLKFVFQMVGVLSLPLPMSVLVRVCFNNTACADVMCACWFEVSAATQSVFLFCPVWFGLWVLLPPPPPSPLAILVCLPCRRVAGEERTPSKKVDVPSRCPWSRSSCTGHAKWSVLLAASELRSGQVLQSQQVRCEVDKGDNRSK